MTPSEAIRAAAEQGCDMNWDAMRNRWIVNRIAVEAETLELSGPRLTLLDRDTFVRDYLPRRLDALTDPSGRSRIESLSGSAA